MSRVIKFRAWATSLETMILPNNLVFHEFIDVEDHFADEDCIYLQFTGLTDKNGKEIFEGDIVTCKMSFKGGSLPHMGEIVYLEDFAGFATRNEAGETLLHHHILSTFEVIGNIYENKELLNGS